MQSRSSRDLSPGGGYRNLASFLTASMFGRNCLWLSHAENQTSDAFSYLDSFCRSAPWEATFISSALSSPWGTDCLTACQMHLMHRIPLWCKGRQYELPARLIAVAAMEQAV